MDSIKNYSNIIRSYNGNDNDNNNNNICEENKPSIKKSSNNSKFSITFKGTFNDNTFNKFFSSLNRNQ